MRLTPAGRKGGTTVEAAVVLPLTILTVITCMLICMFFYTETIRRSMLHTALRHAAEDSCGRSTYPDSSTDGRLDILTEKRGFYYTSRGEEWIIMKKNILISKRADRKIEDVWTTVDGVSYVRYCTLANRVAEEIKDYR